MPKGKTGSRLIALLLAVLMLVAYMPMLGDAVYAEDGIPVITTDKTEYVVGEDINVTTTLNGASGGWVAMYSGDTTSYNTSILWYYPTDGGSKKLQSIDAGVNPGNEDWGEPSYYGMDIPAGDYQLVYAYGGKPYAIKGEPVRFSVVDEAHANNNIKTDKKTYHLSDPIMVTAKSDAENFWVGIYGKDENPDGGPQSIYWYSGHNGEAFNIKDGTKNRSLGVGEYKVLLFGDGGFTNVLDRVDITIEKDPVSATISTDKEEYEIGETVKVTCATEDETGGWVAIYPNDAEGYGTSTLWYYPYDTSAGKQTSPGSPDGTEQTCNLIPDIGQLGPGKWKAVYLDSDYNPLSEPAVFTIKCPGDMISLDTTRHKYDDKIIRITLNSEYVDTFLSVCPDAWIGLYDRPERTGGVDIGIDKENCYFSCPVKDFIDNSTNILEGKVEGKDYYSTEEGYDPYGRYRIVLFSGGYDVITNNIKSFYVERVFAPSTWKWYEEDGEQKAYAVFASTDGDGTSVEVDAVVTSETTDSSCTEAGKTVYTATIDAAALEAAGIYFTETEAPFTDTKTVEIPKKDHTPDEAVEENKVDSTCKEAGSYDEVVYCKDCKAEISRTHKTIEKKAHTEEVIPAKEATCTETGLTEGKKCSVCGEVLVEQQEVPMKDHTPAEAVKEDGEDASCEAAGFHFDVVKCSVCGEEISRTKVEDPALGHDYQVVEGSAKAATFEEAGKEADKKCSRCGDVITGAEIPKLTAEASLSKTKFHYTGKVQKPEVKVAVNGTELDPKDFEVTIPSSKKIGAYKVTVKTTGDYAGFETTLNYQIAPKKVALKSVAKGTKSFTAKWAKQSATAKKNIGGFQLRYSKDKNFAKGVVLSKKLSNKTTKWVKKGLKKKTKYYVQIRTYKKVNGKYYYSDWSKYKIVTTR